MTDSRPENTAAKPRLHWYQYSLRSLLVATAALAVLMGVNTRPIGFLMLETIDGEGFSQLLQTRGEDYGWP
jgi:hypothetical protein